MTDRLLTFRTKYPDRCQRLEALVRPLVGIPRVPSHDSLAQRTLNDVLGRLLAAIYGDEEEIVSPVPPTPSESPK